MFRKSLIAPLLAASAMALTVSPAYAGKTDRAREAIAAAEAKIHTAEQLGAATEMPERNAEARAALARAKEHFDADKKSTSIEEAIHASALADATIGELQQRKNAAVADANAARNADVTAAQQQAAQANARADMAQQQAARSAAEANAARIAAEHPQVETTVTTQQPRASHTVTRKTTTTSRAPTAPPVTTTTTTVKQAVN